MQGHYYPTTANANANVKDTHNSTTVQQHKWVCDSCNVCVFSTYEDAKRHEAVCRCRQHSPSAAIRSGVSMSASASSRAPAPSSLSYSMTTMDNSRNDGGDGGGGGADIMSSALTDVFIPDSRGKSCQIHQS